MKADEYLEERGLEFDVVEHEEKVETCKEAAEARGLKTSQVVKSLIIERDEELLHCLVPGDRKLSGSKVGDHRMVEPEKSRELTGQRSGTVHPFSTDLDHLADHRLFEQEILSFTTGEFDEAVKINPEEFRRALELSGFDVEFGEIVDSTEEETGELTNLGIKREEAKFVVSRGYRRMFLSLKDEFDPEIIVTALRKLEREQVDPEAETVSKLIQRSNSETHMQKLASKLASQGELPEEEGFDLEESVTEVIQENPGAVEDYLAGKESAINYLMGQVMEKTSGRADPGKVREKLEDNL